jgi:hypothetical protein
VRIASQILQYAARTAEGRLDVDHPMDGGGLRAQGLKGIGFGERLQFTVEAERTLAEGLAQRA